MKTSYPDPFRIWTNGMQLAMLLAEAQMVIAMRLMGMSGLWSVTPYENTRMVSEKAHALARSASDSSRAILRGAGPDAVLAAAIRPIRRKTRANARRLGKRGPRRR